MVAGVTSWRVKYGDLGEAASPGSIRIWSLLHVCLKKRLEEEIFFEGDYRGVLCARAKQWSPALMRFSCVQGIRPKNGMVWEVGS